MNLTTDSHTLKTLLKGAKRIWIFAITIFILFSIVLTGGIYFYTNHKSNVQNYEATSKILLTPNYNKEYDGGTTQMYLNSEKTILESQNIKAKFLKSIGKKYSWKKESQINYKIKIKDGTSVASIKVQAPTAKMAKQTSNQLAKMIIENKYGVLQKGEATIIEKSKKAKLQIVVTSHKKYYLAAIILSLLISILLTLVRSYFDDRIYDVNVLKGYLRNLNIYETKNDNVLTVLKKINKVVRAEKKNEPISIYFFDKNVGGMVIKSVSELQPQNGYIIFSDGEISDESKLSLDALYTNKEKTNSFDIVDCSTEININNTAIPVLVIQDGKTMKKQVAEIYNELQIAEINKVFVVYLQ